MDTARIALLLEPFLEESLGESQLQHISIYIDLLNRWNARINLTAIRNEDEMVTRHFGESLFLARHLFPAMDVSVERAHSPANAESAGEESVDDLKHLVDVGSGAGFPALPLKIWAPETRLTLIESNHKKATFLREVARTLTLTDVNVITERAETAASNKAVPRGDVVTLRAVERFETILPHAAAFLTPGGTLALLIGESQLPVLAAMPTIDWTAPMPVPQSQSRVLSIGVLGKVG